MKRVMPTIRESAEELKARLKGERDRRKGQRLQALYLVQSGQARDRLTVAALLGVDRNTVGRWLRKYEQGGLESLLALEKPVGKRAALTEAQREELKVALRDPRGFGSYREIQAWIATTFAVQMSVDAVRKLVYYKLGARAKVARPSHPKKTLPL